jgi:hypothetical protein
VNVGIPARGYRQPRRLNAVSLTLLVLVVIAAYVGFSAWPVVVLHADIKDALEDALPRLYRANLLPESESDVGAEQVHQLLLEKLTTLGVADPDTALTITRNSQTVSIAVKVNAAINLKLIHKVIPVALNPRVETSAARVAY